MTSRPKELRGKEAEVFAEEHLERVNVNPETWEVEYVDPKTGKRWLMDYPNGEAHGGGAPRLRIQEVSVGVDTQRRRDRGESFGKGSASQAQAIKDVATRPRQ